MPFKILYAAGNRRGANTQLLRCLSHLNPQQYIVKTAGYRRMGMFLDWTLDALLNMFNPKQISFESDNFDILLNQVRYFAPDLIISDLEIFISTIGSALNIPVWQVSPCLLQQLNLPTQQRGRYETILDPTYAHQELINNMVFNADRCYLYSHFGDTINPISLPDNIRWLQPYHYLGKLSLPCQHNIVALDPSTKICEAISNYSDTVAFTYNYNQSITNIIVKDAYNYQEYACNVKNCLYYVSPGTTDGLSDAFYNGKFVNIMPDLFDIECILNMFLTQHHKTGTICFQANIQLNNNVESNTSRLSKYSLLHQELDEFFDA